MLHAYMAVPGRCARCMHTGTAEHFSGFASALEDPLRADSCLHLH